MKKPRWVGDDTPEILEILAGRSWDDLDPLDRETLLRIERAVAARPEAVTLPSGSPVKGTHGEQWNLRESRLWNRRRAFVDDPASGVLEWGGRDHEPEHPSLVPDRAPKGKQRSYHLTIGSDQWTDVGGERIRVTPRPRRPGDVPGPKQSAPGCDLTDPGHRAELIEAWKRAGEGGWRRSWRRIVAGSCWGETTIRGAFARDGYDRARFLSTGEVEPVE